MDATIASLLFGCAGAGLAWWGAQTVVRRTTAQRLPQHGAGQVQDAAQQDKEPWKQTPHVYKRIVYWRLSGFFLCCLAAVLLYASVATTLAFAIAATGCFLQYIAYRIRTQHVHAVVTTLYDDLEQNAIQHTK